MSRRITLWTTVSGLAVSTSIAIAVQQSHAEMAVSHNRIGLVETVERLSPVGSIQTSWLSLENFRRYANDSEEIPVWVPCDGREITYGPLVGTLTPDLRGVFLRGVNTMDDNEVTTVADDRRNPENARLTQYQEDQVGRHQHSVLAKTSFFKVFGTPAATNSVSVLDIDNGADRQENAEVVMPSAGVETRPKNVSVAFYCKVL